MRKIMIAAFLLMGLAVIATSCENSKKKSAVENKEVIEHDGHDHDSEAHEHSDSDAVAAVYQCPMKCEGEKTYDEKGSCPVCKMDIKEIELEKAEAAAEEEEEEEEEETE